MKSPAVIQSVQEAETRPVVTQWRWIHPVWITLAAVVLAVGAQLAAYWRLPMPQCVLRKVTGVPCPTCGCTRSLVAWSQLEVAEAFRYNPLFSVLLVGLLIWLMAWGIERISRRPFLSRWRAGSARWPWGWIFIVLAAANWVYLCFRLPR